MCLEMSWNRKAGCLSCVAGHLFGLHAHQGWDVMQNKYLVSVQDFLGICTLLEFLFCELFTSCI